MGCDRLQIGVFAPSSESSRLRADANGTLHVGWCPIGRTTLEGDDLLGPKCPVGEFVEGGAAGAREELFFANAACVHAPATESDLGTAVEGGGEHPFEVVVAGGCLLAGERAGDGVREQEDANLFAVSFG
jgi:hypothetical protein